MARRGPACTNFEAHKFRPGFCLHCMQRGDQHVNVPVSTAPSITNTGTQSPVTRAHSPSTNQQLPKRPLPAPPSEHNSPVTSLKSTIPAKPLPSPPANRQSSYVPTPTKTPQIPNKPRNLAFSEPIGNQKLLNLEETFLAKQQLKTKDKPNINLFYIDLIKTILADGLKISNLNVDELCRQTSLLSPKLNERPKLLFEKGDIQFLNKVKGKINRFVFDHKEMERIILIQSVIRFWRVKKRFKHMTKIDLDNLRKKNAVFLDLLKTEQNYIQSINNLIKNFVVPIRQSEFVAPNECAFLFSNIESIAEEHTKLYNKLDKLRSDWPFIGNVGAIFLDVKHLLNAHSVYVSNFKNAMNEVRRISNENSKFQSFVDTASEVNDIDLPTSLSLPINRVGKYEYFLGKLIDEIPENTKEREDCVKAFSVLAQSSVVVQRSLLESTETAKILSVQRKLKSDGPINLILAGRLFLYEFKTKKNVIYLFNDIIILSKLSTGKTGRNRIKKLSELKKTNFVDVDSKTFDLVQEGESFKIVAFSAEDKTEFYKRFEAVKLEVERDKVFGVALGETVIREERATGVPFIIEKLTNFILENCSTTPGIFRVAGSALEIQALKQVFDDGGPAAVQLNLQDKNPYSVCDCLKLYFRSLPEPMLGYDLYRPIVELMRDTSIANEDRIAKIKELLFTWTPSFALKVLRYLINFLSQIARNSEENKMTSSNLAIVFGPTLLWSNVNTLESAMDMPYINSAVNIIIDYSGSIWQN